VRCLAPGRIWWPVATALVRAFPGFSGSLLLGQNATHTLTILVWGWVLVTRGRPAWGGAVWGLLAFKPVWALAFFLVPLLSRRWRFCAAMAATGAGLALLTLPFVGVGSWKDWLAIGKEAADLYDVERNWIFLSRVLLTEPRRYLSPLLVVLARLRNDAAGRSVVAYHQPGVPEALPPAVPLQLAPRAVWALNRMAPTAFVLLLLIHYLFPVLGWGSH